MLKYPHCYFLTSDFSVLNHFQRQGKTNNHIAHSQAPAKLAQLTDGDVWVDLNAENDTVLTVIVPVKNISVAATVLTAFTSASH